MNSRKRRYPVPWKPRPALDFTSESFDPKKALSIRNIRLLFPKAKTYNNLAEYYSHTFLKKNLERKEKAIPQERNYQWYIRTLGLWGRRAQLFEENLKSRRDRNRRVGKKPIRITYVPGSPLRSEKVIKLKSSYKSYWKRKCLLYKKGIEREESRALFQKIKWLAKPLTASDLIQKAVQNCITRSNTSEAEDTVTESHQTANSSHVDCETSSEASHSNSEGSESSNSASDCNDEEKRSCKGKNGKSAKRFLAVKSKNSQKSVFKEAIKADSSELNNGITTKKGQNHSNNVLTSRENLNTKQKSSISKNSIEPAKVETSPKLPKVKRLKAKKCSKITIKENASVSEASCTCFPKVSSELWSQCKCGFYSTAMKNLQKFKIPKKKKPVQK